MDLIEQKDEIKINVIKELVSSELYQSIITDIQRSNLLKISATECENKKTEAIIYGLLLRNITNADLSIEAIKDCLVVHREELVQYSIKKHHVIDGVKDKQEYPEGEEIEEESKEICQGYSKIFVLMNIIEYVLAKQGKVLLENYLKRNRIPCAKKYTKQILTEFMP